jgi:outer membrane protein assembly factor BamA
MHAYGQTNSDTMVIKEIFIKGNKITRSQVIYREINFHKGERLTRDGLDAKMAQSEKFLFNQSLFLKVSIRDSLSGNNAYVFIALAERFNVDFWHPVLKYADRNLTEWLSHPTLYRLTYGIPIYISNVTGLNDRLTLSPIFGWRETYGVDYRTPYLNKAKTLVMDAAFAYQRGHEVGAITLDNQLQYVRVDSRNIINGYSAKADLIYRKRYQVSHTLELGYDNYNVDDTVVKINPQYLGEGRKTLGVPRIAYHFLYDKRDYTVYAKKGDLIFFGIEQDGLPLISKDVDVTTLDLEYRKFIPLHRNFFYDGGFLVEYNLQKNLPYIFRSPLGYRYQVRGYEHFLSEGQGFLLIGNELKYLAFSHSYRLPYIREGQFNPVPVHVYVKLFTDQGYVYYNPAQADISNSLLNKLLIGWGPGIDVTSYYDFVLRVEYSFNLLHKSGFYLHFTEVF